MSNNNTLPRQNREVSALADRLKKQIQSMPDSSFLASEYYYVSASGNDENDGRTPKTAWRSLVKVEQMHTDFKPGTAVLFERGGIYRGWFSASNGCYYGAYGTGAKPHLYASLENYTDPAFWTQESDGVWVCTVLDFLDQPMSDIGQINCDDGRAIGFKRAQLSDVQQELDFYYDIPTGKLTFKHNGNPALCYEEIELCPNFHVISGYGVHDVVIENLDIRYTGGHGIATGQVADNISIRGCEFKWIGGSYLLGSLRYGNAIELWENGNGFLVENCYIREVYDTGITHQGQSGQQENISIYNNLIEDCCYGIEYFVREGEDSLMKNIHYKGNIIRNVGYGWGKQRPNPDANSAICGWWYDNWSENFVIEDNILENSDWYLVYIGNPKAEGADLIIRNNSYYQDICGEKCASVYWDNKTPYHAKSKEEFLQQVLLVDSQPKAVRFYVNGEELI
ncbi:MAG: right-handed parallel beta-helix repeat-containing protein [Clostridia bacterium]|nr:right-handed parallel beta-helix repeat-containing protein [Clostridia bacterium]